MKIHIEIDGCLRKVELSHPAENEGGFWRATIDGQAVTAEARLLRPGVLSLILDGRSYRIVLEDAAEDPALYVGSRRVVYRMEDPRSLKSRRARAGAGDGPKTLKASMPGRVVRVLAAKGEEVKAHQGIVVIEAMKMQNELKSPKDGRIADLRVAPGDTVSAGDVLAVIE
jgi:biotin carboxyl carrier protein